MRTRPVRWTRTRSGPWATASPTAVPTPSWSKPAAPRSIRAGNVSSPSRGRGLHPIVVCNSHPLEGGGLFPEQMDFGSAGVEHPGVTTAVCDAVAHGPERVRVHRTGRVRIYHACDATHDR